MLPAVRQLHRPGGKSSNLLTDLVWILFGVVLRIKIQYDSEQHNKILKALHDKMKEKFGDVDTLDGLKAIIDEDSWVLVRRSNTENAIRISAESNSLEKVRKIDQEIKDLIKESYE